MLEKLADWISCYLVRSGAAVEADREVIAFGWFRILSNVLQYGILLVSSVLLGVMPEVAAYTLMFATLKRYAGGTHANNHIVCLVVTTALPYVAYILCRLIPAAASPYASVSVAVFTLAVVLLRAPVVHPNNPKKPKSLKKFRKIAVCIAVTQAVVIAGGSPFASGRVLLCVLCGAMGGLSAGVSLLLPMKKGGERE